ncbi:MAG: ABC transporter permease [Deltaproteobacteria bacterium]|nr:ABC transporter permease [Deltaproteobacteria bacterium]
MSANAPVHVLGVLFEFLRRDFKLALSYRLQAFFQVASLFSLAVTLFFLSLMLQRVEGSIPTLGRYGGGYFGFALIGLAISFWVDAPLRVLAGSIRTAQMTGTFEAMLATPTPLWLVALGSGLYGLVNAAMRVALLLFFAAVIFEVPLHLDRWPALAVVLLLALSATFVLGIFSAGFIVLFKQGDPLSAAISGLSWLLSGVLYPREILPAWVQRAADFLPLTHALESARLTLLLGTPLAALGRPIAYLAAFSAIGLPLALAWFRWTVGRARVAGSLARY